MQNSIVFKTFKKTLKIPTTIDFKTINQVAIPKGYIVSKDACNEEVLEWLNQQPTDFNSTFYKSWNDVLSKSRLEIAFDQITNYFTNYLLGYSTIPNDGSQVIPFNDLIVIDTITKEEVIKYCQDLLYSGSALKSETINDIFLMVDLVDVEVEKVKNREAQIKLYDLKGEVPTNVDQWLNFVILKATGNTMKITDSKTISKLSTFNAIEYFKNADLVELSKGFNRNKKYFMALKNKDTKKYVNKITKLSKKYHKPYNLGFFEDILNKKTISDIALVEEKVENISNFQKIKLLQAIKIRETNHDLRFFRVRNGKMFVKEEKQVSKQYYKAIYNVIYRSLVKSLSKKATTVSLPKNVEYVAPTSEKNFVGNLPQGTSFPLHDQNTIIGIHRTKENAAGFLDFSLNNNNHKIGWNSSFKNKGNTILFSGDVCHDDCSKEATELFYAKEGFDESFMAVVNNFDSFNEDKSIPFKFFIAKEKISKIEKDYMVDPNNIYFMVDLETVVGKKESSIGILTPDKFILGQFQLSNKMISGKSITNNYIDYGQKDIYIPLKPLLKDAGFEIVEENGKLDFSLDMVKKDDFLNLFS